MDKKPIAIIMCVHNSGKYLQIALDCIINRTQYPYKIILVESESTDGTDEVCDYYAKTYDQVEVYHTKKEGLVKAMNFGIMMAGDLDVYITQDDVLHPRLFGRDWLQCLVEASKLESCGIVTSILAGGISGTDYLAGLQWAGTWSLFIPRSTINKIGVFDEAYSPGMGDDIDYSYRVYKAGLRIYLANFWVDHHRSSEHFNESQDLSKAHGEYFRKKFKLGEFANGITTTSN